MPILNRKNQNVFWLISLVILTAITAFVYWSGESSGSSVDENKFTLKVNSIITSVEIASSEFSYAFQYENGKWMVNNSFEMDPGMRDAFFTVISSIRVQRAVGQSDRDSIADFLADHGIHVRIINNQEPVKDYLVGGDEIRSVSYFMDPEEKVPYLVRLPGYDSYVAGLFSVPVKDWRNRFILELDWSNLKKVEVDYNWLPKDNFSIEYEGDFFHLDNKSENLDSAAVFDFIGELSNLQADKFLDAGQSPKYDSLCDTNAEARITVSLIGQSDQVLEVFPLLKKDRYQLAKLNGDLRVLFNPRALKPILLKKEDW